MVAEEHKGNGQISKVRRHHSQHRSSHRSLSNSIDQRSWPKKQIIYFLANLTHLSHAHKKHLHQLIGRHYYILQDGCGERLFQRHH